MAATQKPGRDRVKYWRAVDAIEALGSASLAEVEEWDLSQHPHDPLGNARADLELFTVNSPSRIHYNYSRTNWRSTRITHTTACSSWSILARRGAPAT